MASPAFSAIGTLSNINNTTSIPRPAVSDGDAMLMVVLLAYGNAACSTPAGWTLVSSLDIDSGYEPAIYVFGKVASSEGASYSVTISGQPGGNNIGVGVILAYTGALSSGTFVAPATQRNTSASTSATIPGTTATSANTTQVAIYVPANSSSPTRSWTPPSGMTERHDLGQNPTGYVLGIADIAIASAGAISSRTATLDASHTSNTITVLIASEAPAADGTAPTLSSPTGAGGVLTGSGTVSTDEANGTLWWKADGTSTASDPGAGSEAGAGWSSQSVSATGTQTVSSFGALSAGTTYVHYLHVDAAGNRSTVANSAGFNVTSGAATAVTLSGPSSGAVAVASTNFTAGANGTITGTVTVTPSDSGGGGTFTPTSVNISSGTPTATFTYTPASSGAKSITVTNNGGLTNPSALTYTASSTPGFDLHTITGLVFGDLAGALTSLARQTSVAVVARAYNPSTGVLAATSGTLTTDSNGRLPRWQDAALSAATAYTVTFTRASDSEVCAARLTTT